MSYSLFFAIVGRLYWLIINRIPLFLVKNLIDQLTKVMILFLNPKIETKCTNIQIAQAKNPFKWKLPMSTTARLRPTVAIEPLSKYLKSSVDCWFKWFKICLAT